MFSKVSIRIMYTMTRGTSLRCACLFRLCRHFSFGRDAQSSSLLRPGLFCSVVVSLFIHLCDVPSNCRTPEPISAAATTTSLIGCRLLCRRQYLTGIRLSDVTLCRRAQFSHCVHCLATSLCKTHTEKTITSHRHLRRLSRTRTARVLSNANGVT